MELTKAPKPGIYRDMPMEEYQAIDACNFSALKVLREYSPKHYKAIRDGELKKDSKALKRGRALHTALLEGEEVFKATYITGAKCSAMKKGDGKPCTNDAKVYSGGKWFCGTHEPDQTEEFAGEILTQADMDMVTAISRAVSFNPVASAFITMGNKTRDGKSNNEVTVVWVDPDFDVPCKARLDMVREEHWGAIGDLKTCANPNPRAFSDTIGEYWYDGQAGFYRKGWVLAGGNELPNFNFFALQSTFPHDIGLFSMLDPEEMGWYSTRKWVGVWAGCWRNGHWPGCDSNFADIQRSKRTHFARVEELKDLNIGVGGRMTFY